MDRERILTTTNIRFKRVGGINSHCRSAGDNGDTITHAKILVIAKKTVIYSQVTKHPVN